MNPQTRRGFLRDGGLLALGAALGMTIPHARHFPPGLIPAAFAADNIPAAIPGKEGLIILNDRPWNAETPAHLLDDPVTPNHRRFVRNNGLAPENIDPDSWRLEVGGERRGDQPRGEVAGVGDCHAEGGAKCEQPAVAQENPAGLWIQSIVLMAAPVRSTSRE